ncbi:hypothetical protein D3C71_1872590 [compost metagenome]
MPARYNVVHDPRRGLLNVDRGKMTCFCQGTRQNNVAIQNGTRCIGNRILLVITF